MNNRPDFQSWLRMIRNWNHQDADFHDAFRCSDPGVAIRLSSDPECQVVKLNASNLGRTTLVVQLGKSGSKKKSKKRDAPKILVDVFTPEGGGEPDVYVFIQAHSLKSLTRAVLKVQSVDLDEEFAAFLSRRADHPSQGGSEKK